MSATSAGLPRVIKGSYKLSLGQKNRPKNPLRSTCGVLNRSSIRFSCEEYRNLLQDRKWTAFTAAINSALKSRSVRESSILSDMFICRFFRRLLLLLLSSPETSKELCEETVNICEKVLKWLEHLSQALRMTWKIQGRTSLMRQYNAVDSLSVQCTLLSEVKRMNSYFRSSYPSISSTFYKCIFLGHPQQVKLENSLATKTTHHPFL